MDRLEQSETYQEIKMNIKTWKTWLLLLAMAVFVGCSNDTTEEGSGEEPSDTNEQSGAQDGDEADASDEAVAGSETDAGGETENKQSASADDPSEEPGVESASGEESGPITVALATTAPPPNGKGPVGLKSGTAGDWPMWGGNGSRNMVNATTGINLDFDTDEGKNVIWTAELGSQTYGNPVVAGGKVFVGTNNGGEYRDQHKGDRGIILCFNEADGKFLWQLTREKLPQGRVNDWPLQGICSTPCVEDGLLYVATNRCELMCIDVEGFHDGENDGEYQEEVDKDKLDADIVWSLDMIEELGVFPHNLATSSPVIHGDLILLVTSNGVDEAHLEVPSPRAPSFLAVNKKTGEVVWEAVEPTLDSKAPEPFNNILHGQWGSPAVGKVGDQTLVFMPGGDGVLYAYDVQNGGDGPVWWFDLNPKESLWELGGRGSRNAIISTPAFIENSVILAVGQDPEHGEGVGHLYRIDATKKGDVSPQVADGDGWKANPNSGQIWHVGGIDEDGSVTGEENGLIFRRTISTFAVSNGLVYAPDLSGFLHCIDFKTGKKLWVHDTFAAVWGSPMVVDGHVLLGDEDGEMVILEDGPKENVIEEKIFQSSIYSTPTIANGHMYVSDRSRLYAIKIK